MQTFLVTFRNLKGYVVTDLVTGNNSDIVKGRLTDYGYSVISIELYA